MDRIKKLREFLERQPDDAFLLHALALEHMKINELGAARTLFERILQGEPTHTGTYYHLAKLLEAQGEKQEAIRVYEQGMEACTRMEDQHALRELRSAYEDLVY